MVRVKSARLRLTLRQGTVYFMPHRGLTSPLPHYLAVVNRDPLSDELLVLSVVTSSVALRRKIAAQRNQPAETIVEFGPSDYAPLSHPSCIDCNTLQTMTAAEFEREVLSGEARAEPDLPPPVLARVLAGILASSRVRPELKALIR